uniref:Uncharacterized protein n=1 Tax=Anguilla anguilla TaxID=7936 RepID=A0A0E9X5X9_ANGAN
MWWHTSGRQRPCGVLLPGKDFITDIYWVLMGQPISSEVVLLPCDHVICFFSHMEAARPCVSLAVFSAPVNIGDVCLFPRSLSRGL